MDGDQLLERARRAPNGWRARDVHRLLGAFGFEFFEGGDHRIYRHAEHPDLQVVVPRHREVRSCYIRQAAAIITELQARTNDQER
jgi:hypothetical protein